MGDYFKAIQLRWADLDVNGHVRHSVYYDWGAFCRIEFLREYGLSVTKMHELGIGPVLFREECLFKREIRQEDAVTINVELTKARSDFSRFSMRHTLVKNGDIIAAVMNVDGAWMDTTKRRLAAPPELAAATYDLMPRAADFEWQTL